MLKKYLLTLVKILACGLLLGACFSSATWAQPSQQNQTVQVNSPEGIVIYRGLNQGSPSVTLKLPNTEINVTTLPNGSTLIRTPDGQYALKPQEGMPYCTSGCDIDEDCTRGRPGLGNAAGWHCINVKGFCRGECVQKPSGQ